MMDPECFYDLVTLDRRFNLPLEAVGFLDRVVSLLEDMEFEKGKILFRAQLGGDSVRYFVDETLEVMGVQAFGSSRMVPDAQKCDAGRFSIKELPALYFADKQDTAIKEVRPWRGAEISIAIFSTKQQFKMAVVPFSRWGFFEQIKEHSGMVLNESSLNKKAMAYVYRWFSAPNTSVNEEQNYIVTQIIAERIRLEGYDGILFESVANPPEIAGLFFCPPKNDPQQYFPSIVEFQHCDMVRVKELDIKMDDEYASDPTVFQTGKNDRIA